MTASAKTEKSTVKTDEATVAIGRSIRVSGRAALAGEVVELPVAEIARLRRLGFLVDPDAPTIARGFGPNYAAPRGATIKRA